MVLLITGSERWRYLAWHSCWECYYRGRYDTMQEAVELAQRSEDGRTSCRNRGRDCSGSGVGSEDATQPEELWYNVVCGLCEIWSSVACRFSRHWLCNLYYSRHPRPNWLRHRWFAAVYMLSAAQLGHTYTYHKL